MPGLRAPFAVLAAALLAATQAAWAAKDSPPKLPPLFAALERALPHYTAGGIDSIKMTAAFESSYTTYLSGSEKDFDMKGLRFALTQRETSPGTLEFKAKLLNRPKGMSDVDAASLESAAAGTLSSKSFTLGPFWLMNDFLGAPGAKVAASKTGRKITITVPKGAKGWAKLQYVLAADRSTIEEAKFDEDGSETSRITHSFRCAGERCVYLGHEGRGSGEDLDMKLQWKEVGGVSLPASIHDTCPQENLDQRVTFSKHAVDIP